MVDKDRCEICLRPGYTLWGVWKGTVLDACVELGKYFEESFGSMHVCVQRMIYEDTPRTNHRAKVSRFQSDIFPAVRKQHNCTQMEFLIDSVFKRPFGTNPTKLSLGNDGNGLLVFEIHYVMFEQIFATIGSVDKSAESWLKLEPVHRFWAVRLDRFHRKSVYVSLFRL